MAIRRLNDITSFVDFTAIATAAHEAGFSVAGYTSQASFLQNCGVLELLGSVGPSDSPAYLRAARAALRLVAPHEMGELFKVLLLTRGLDEAWLGVLRGDRTHAL
jgi:SAM-dependent MidA family methyltransferase